MSLALEWLRQHVMEQVNGLIEDQEQEIARMEAQRRAMIEYFIPPPARCLCCCHVDDEFTPTHTTGPIGFLAERDR